MTFLFALERRAIFIKSNLYKRGYEYAQKGTIFHKGDFSSLNDTYFRSKII